jgi:hypothetical protein
MTGSFDWGLGSALFFGRSLKNRSVRAQAEMLPMRAEAMVQSGAEWAAANLSAAK